MKELSIKEKAERYNNAIKKAKSKMLYPDKPCFVDIREIFPELKESEDERIRKELLEHCKNQAKPYIQTGNKCPQIQSWIAWLEKQGEKPQGKSALEAAKEEKVDNQNCVKPVDEVEPKFKVGDWIVNNSNKEIFLIKHVNDAFCTLKDVKGEIHSPCLPPTEDDYHLWTIRDAKNGDVLACKGNVKNSNGIKYERICLFNNLDNAFFTLTKLSNFVEEYDIDIKIDYPDNTVPATKEQKEILFMTMANAGYTFDFDKKELKKVEQKPTFDVEIPFGAKDSELREATYFIPKGFHAEIDGDKVHIEKGGQKLAWSEEDEEMFDDALRMIEWYIRKNESKCQSVSDWLKSLKDRVGCTTICK